MENIAIVKINKQIYKSNKVIVYNKKCDKFYKIRKVYSFEDCNNIYIVKTTKYVRCEKINYKIYIIVCDKCCNIKYKRCIYI